MRKSKFTEAQIVAILKEGAAMARGGSDERPGMAL
jgi:hypothetical protein